MASILKPFANLLNPGAFQVPTGGMSIDWTHPLANGMIACFLPGLGFTDLVSGLVAVPQSAASLGAVTQEGVGLSSQAANTGASTTAPLPSAFTTWTGFTIRWRGYVVSTPAFGVLFAVSYDSSGGNNPPYFFAGLRWLSGAYSICWNTGTGSIQQAGGNTPTLPLFVDIVGTFTVNGTNSLYENGVLDGHGGFFPVTWGSGSPTSNNPILMLNGELANAATRFSGGICNIAQMWNRSLSPAEVQALYLNPYSMIVPAEYDLPTIFMPPPPPIPLAQILIQM